MPLTKETRVRPGNTRVTGKEQYYTPPELAKELVKRVESKIGSLQARQVLEPAGGAGAFVEAALAAGASVISLDIEPQHPGVKRANFLETHLDETGLITISNPPFGRNNSLSVPFFNQAARSSEFICFIVPRSWRKWSVINRLDKNFELIHDENLEIDYVDSSGKEISNKSLLATCFQIWRRVETKRALIKVKDMGLVKKVAPEEADVSLTVFGYGCGRVQTEFEKKPNTTQMFLSLRHPQALEALLKSDFSQFYKNTAYTEALSFQEINYLLNDYILGDPMMEGF
jgi:predicted RNA methylase